MDGILIGGPDADKLPPNETLERDLAGHRRLPDADRRRGKAGAQARFESAADAALRDRIEDKIWAIHEETTELVTRAMEAGTALTQDLRGRASTSGAVTLEDVFDTDYVEISGTNPVQYRTKMLDWADRALPRIPGSVPRQGHAHGVLRHRRPATAILPVHNKIYSHPQRPGDVAYNTANCRNRRIFNDAAGLAAARNQRAYLIQSYARDMGRRQHRDDARDRRADPRAGPALGRVPQRVQALMDQ